MNKLILSVLMFGSVLGSTPIAYAATNLPTTQPVVVGVAPVVNPTPVPTSVTSVSKRSHSSGDTTPLFFFEELGINTTPEAANAVWGIDTVRIIVMSAWRHKVFGY
jgi:hypothetical protein